MATGGVQATGSAEERRESLMCSLCLDIYTAPKLLPCSHTYCLQCLKDLTMRMPPFSSSFPCPQCRHLVDVPEGGVAQLKNNNYLRPEELEAAREGSLCLTHPQEVLDLYCSDCKRLVCLKCVLTKHRDHRTEDLDEAAVTARAELKDNAERLEKSLQDLNTQIETNQQEQRDLKDKTLVVKTVIRNKQATLKALIEKVGDDMLKSLSAVTKNEKNRLTQELDRQTSNRHELQQLLQQVQQALNSGSDRRQLALARETEDRASNPAILPATSAATHVIKRPVVSSSIADDVLMQQMTSIFGAVRMEEMAVTISEVNVEQQFHCGIEPDTEVFSLCPMDDGFVYLSYCRKGFSNNVPCEIFDLHSKKLAALTYSGKRSYKSIRRDKYLCISCSDRIRTNRKSHAKPHLRLDAMDSDTAYLNKETVLSEEPFKTETTKEFRLKVGRHRAMDVDPTDQLVAVVEEPRDPGASRAVKLFRRPRPHPVVTYRAPSKTFNPSDVCFFKLGGQQLIADEAGDSVHVVQMEEGTLQFRRHLAPGNPLLVQPTALNVDHRGRLWLACRGGAVITFTPISQ